MRSDGFSRPAALVLGIAFATALSLLAAFAGLEQRANQQRK